MRRSTSLYLLCALTLASTMARGDSWWQPDHAQAQFAGTIGFLSIGAGRSFDNLPLDMTLMLGYLPESIGGDNVYTLALKSDVPLGQFNTLEQNITTYAGLGIHYALNRQFRTSDFPSDYYPATEWNVMPYLGLRLRPDSSPANVSLYTELGVVGHYLSHYYHNPDYLDWGEIINLSVGLRFELD